MEGVADGARETSGDRPSVSVIVPARNASGTLGRTLEALLAQELSEPYEVLVVDDGSDDQTYEIVVRHAPGVRVIRNEESQGPGAARNHGVSASRAPVLAFTDADCFPTGQWLACGLAGIAQADLVQGAVQPDPTVARTPFDRTLVVNSDGRFYQTANLFVRRETFEKVGGFRDWALERSGRRRSATRSREGRPTRAPIGEDALFAWTARRLGARSAFVPEALVYHAVVPLGLRGEMADRWHWTRDMPGLARLVPELRRAVFYRRVFFNFRTARFDLALAALAMSAVTRRRWAMVGVIPYLSWLAESARPWGPRRGLALALGAPISDTTTLLGLLVGSIAWQCPVL